MRRSLIQILPLLISINLIGQNSFYQAHSDSAQVAMQNENYLEAIRLFKIAANDTLLAALANFKMGIAYDALSDFENATTCFEKALILYHTNTLKKASVYNSMGILYQRKGEPQKSIHFFKKAIALKSKSIYLANLSNVFLYLPSPDSAIYYFKKSNIGQTEQTIFNNTVYFALNLSPIKAEESYKLVLGLKPKSTYAYQDIYYYLLGKYYSSRHWASKARRAFEKSLSICKYKIWRAYILGELERYRDAISIIDTLLVSSEIYSSRINLAATQAQFYNKLIMRAMNEQKYDSAFYYTEKSKSVALKAYLNRKGISQISRVKSIKDTQASLRDNEILFEYKVIDSLMLCFEISDSSFKFQPTRLEPTFFKAIQDVDEICTEVEYPMPHHISQYCKGAHYLYETFFGGRNIKGKNLVIVPDGWFYNLSFDALLTTPGDTTDYLFKDMAYLVRQNAVRYVYTASMNRTVHYHKLEILHIAPPVKLAGAQKLRRTIKRYSRFYDQFTKPELKEEMKKHAFLHFDTHGCADAEESLKSYLSLGTDSLFLSEVIQEDLPHADMVFLAACNTGVGKYSEGEGSINLERGFMLAGAKTVVSAFWLASDLYAPRIISTYYRELRKGAYPEDAMRMAKLEFLNAPTKANRHGYLPFNWATYNVIGASGAVPHAGKKLSLITWTGFPLLFLFLLAILLWPRKPR